MSRVLTVLLAAAAMTVAFQPGMSIAESVIVVDAPDVQRLDGNTGGFRTSDVIGTDVYSNGGKRIGEVEDFTVASGRLYAVVDIQESQIERYIELPNDGDMVVIPWDQLRTLDRQALSGD